MSHVSPSSPPSSGTSINTIIGSSGGSVAANSSGSINLLGGSGITVVGNPATSTLTIVNSSPSGLSWVQGATSQRLAVNKGYIITSGNQIFTMPVAAPVGSVISLILNCVSNSSASWIINLSGVTISGTFYGTNPVNYSTGVASKDKNYTCMTMVCVVENVQWLIQSLIGNLGPNI